MRIEEIHIDGFGVWRDQSWKDLRPGVNVFLGPNEAGKTTLMNFVRSVLFGFERRNHPSRYDPLRGGSHGGSLVLSQRGRRVAVERTEGRHVRGDVQIRVADDSELSLDDMLGGTTRTLFHNVFAFGLDELEQFRTLENTEVASYVSGAGMGIGAARWTAVWKELEDRRSRLYLPRGQKTTINAALRELEAVRTRIEKTAEEPEEYARALERRAQLVDEIEEADRRIRALSTRVSRYEKLLQWEPHRRKRDEIRALLDNVEPASVVDSFPEGGAERLNLLLHQRRQIDQELQRHREDVERIRREKAELMKDYSPQEFLRRQRVLEALRSSFPRLEALDEGLARVDEATRALEAEKCAALARREKAAPPPRLVTGVFAGAVGVVVAVLFLAGNPIAGAGVAVLVSLIVLWFQGRVRRVREIDREVRGIDGRIDSAEQETIRLNRERDRIVEGLEAATGRRNVSASDIEREVARLDGLSSRAERIRTIEQSIDEADQRRQGIEDRRSDNDRSVRALLAEAGAVNEGDFFRRGEIYRERQRLRVELEKIQLIDPGADRADGVPAMTGEEYRTASSELGECRARLNALRNEEGRIEARLEQLSTSGERTSARAWQESILASIEQSSEEWAVLTLCRSLLEETRKIYESDRQPEVLKQASSFLDRMSRGRWKRVISRLDSGEIAVESSDGQRIAPENLSRGAAEQLYLAMRMALVREYSRHVETLPVIFDDIFVNFDPDRARAAIECVRDLAATHQVFLFTCHPHLADLVGEVVPSAPRFALSH